MKKLKNMEGEEEEDAAAAAAADDRPNNPFDALTEEIIHLILDRLGDDDPLAHKSFSLACKSFLSAESRHRRSLRPRCSDLLPLIPRRYPFISRLDLSLCPRVDDEALAALARSWSSTLRSVDLSRSRFFGHAGLSSLVANCAGLVEVDLSNATQLTDGAAKAIAEAKNLERLRMGRCKLITDMGVGCIAVGCRKLTLLCLKWCLRVSDLGVGLIAMKCADMRSLDLSYLPITEKSLQPVLKLRNLEELILEGCPGVHDDGLATLKESCPSLKVLNLSNCQNVSYVGLSSLTSEAQCLQQLILSYGSPVTADLGKSLHKFSGLQVVRLDACMVTCSGMKEMVNWSACLKELSLSKCVGVTDDCLSLLVQTQRELRKLDITCCRKITYASINSITSSCSSLCSLRMELCTLVSTDAYLLIGQRCQNLEELDLTDNDIDDEVLMSISRCSKLRILKLGICLKVTDDGLKHIGRHCLSLTELDLYRSMGITDASIAEIALGCPALEMINMAYNENVTDAALISLSKCPRLKALEIRGCPYVSSIGLSAIARGCRRLTLLDIKKCYNINDNGMLSLAQFSPNLRQINLSYCSVTDVGLLALASINCLQIMTILHVAGLTQSGLAAALLACRCLLKVKLHMSFKSSFPESLISYIEARGCVFQWRDKVRQVEMDPKGWKLHMSKSPYGA
ncbi:hypothetical protein EUGRSUZ_J01853 [Eucalyptus grandis]|uniref:Uncharacterized protein n=2 Tax=Eucalyptus grandis TaxID=71139 RepID=A0ACC3J7Q2_EUCGR|nr:hypothetical protein EUGRSUZ_J01853 [Eucalyptus grandis]